MFAHKFVCMYISISYIQSHEEHEDCNSIKRALITDLDSRSLGCTPHKTLRSAARSSAAPLLRLAEGIPASR